ncbi:uncharacterized protein C8Q71DRAFT_866317 [Rhodofomes roseus]|uniref:Uncharacterized protein n=1 Tax=Rhodofomes roseus TaxID=34475 RepID=A0ABQ8L0I2_9APHY|nr:uncharacterized protein C8Q71DRAFT_866317 [Rhodofomes roseus]KAH9844205.1 hypothetical protein C8Q71DRAFT_866317 [Rhodofomes roseus]
MSTETPASTDGTPAQRTIRLNVPPHVYILPGGAFILGGMIGLRRGARTASMQFLAENAHRPPTTVQGWYFYNKTKNYRVLMAGLKEAGRDAARLTATVGVFVAVSEACDYLGGLWGEVREVASSVAVAGAFAGVYRQPWREARRTLAVGLLTGAVLRGLRGTRERLGLAREGREAGEE